MSEYHRLDLEAEPRYVSIYVDGRGEQGSRWITLSPLDARRFAHRLEVAADEVDWLTVREKNEEEARRRAEVEAQSAEAETASTEATTP